MNQRLKELINQVGTDSSGKWIRIDNAEKLAELIIHECSEICIKNQFSGAGHHNNGAVSSSELIKQHFSSDL